MYQWGLPGDIPLAGDFDGDGRTDLAIFRPSDGTWWIRYSSRDYDPLRASVFQWGLPGDIPVSGDFDNDGYSLSTYTYYQWGLPGDVPLSIDLDGDGQNELAVFRPSTGEWWVRYSTYGYELRYYGWYQWGLPGDIPIG